ncbi:MAG: DUF6314 family protein [Pseudomonadota bacterium]
MRLSTIDDIFNHLAGEWSLSRDLDMVGRFTGTARLWVAEPDRRDLLRYREEGVLYRTDGQEFDGFREYDFINTPHGIELRFRDPARFGRFYVCLDFAKDPVGNMTARDIHPCGDDIYHHTMIWHDQNHFETEIKISGPRKDYMLHSLYRRQTMTS